MNAANDAPEWMPSAEEIEALAPTEHPTGTAAWWRSFSDALRASLASRAPRRMPIVSQFVEPELPRGLDARVTQGMRKEAERKARGGEPTLDLATFRAANVRRNLEAFKGGDWSANDWATALAGEVGEACNLLKKRRRGEDVPTGKIADELADVLTYLDLLAWNLDIDLADATVRKFNEVSRRVGSGVTLCLAHRATVQTQPSRIGIVRAWENDDEIETLTEIQKGCADRVIELVEECSRAPSPSPEVAALVEACERWAGCDGCDLIEMHRNGKLADSGYSDSVKRLVPLIVEARAAIKSSDSAALRGEGGER